MDIPDEFGKHVKKRVEKLLGSKSPILDCAVQHVRAALTSANLKDVRLVHELEKHLELLYGFKDGVALGRSILEKRAALLGWLDVADGVLVFHQPNEKVTMRVRTCARAQLDPAAIGGILLVTSWCLERPREGSKMVELVIYAGAAVATRVTRALHSLVDENVEGGGAVTGAGGDGAGAGSSALGGLVSSQCKVCRNARAALAISGSSAALKLRKELGSYFIVRGVIAAVGPLVKINMKTSTSTVESVTPCLLHDVDYGSGDGGGMGEPSGASSPTSPRVAGAAPPTLVLIYGSPRINAAAALLVPGRICTFFLASPFSVKQRDANLRDIAVLCCENSEQHYGDAFPDDWRPKKGFFSCDDIGAAAFPATKLLAALKSVLRVAPAPASPAPFVVAVLRGRVLVATRRLLVLARTGSVGAGSLSNDATVDARPVAVWWGHGAPRSISMTLPRLGSIVDVFGICDVIESKGSYEHMRADARTSWTVFDDAHTFECSSSQAAQRVQALTPPPAQLPAPAPASPHPRTRMSAEYIAKFSALGKLFDVAFCAHSASDSLALRTATARVCQSFFRGSGPRVLTAATGSALNSPQVTGIAGATAATNDVSVYHAFIFPAPPPPSPHNHDTRVREIHTPSSLATAAVICADALSRAAADLDLEPLRQPWAAALADFPDGAAALLGAAEEQARCAVAAALGAAGVYARSVCVRVGRDWLNAEVNFGADAGTTLVARAAFSERTGHWFVSDDVTAFLALAVVGGGALPSTLGMNAAAVPTASTVPFMHCDTLTLRVDVVRVKRSEPATTLATSNYAPPLALQVPSAPGSFPIQPSPRNDELKRAVLLPAVLIVPDAAVAWEASVAAAASSPNAGVAATAAGGPSGDSTPDPFTGEHSLGALRGAFEAAGAALGVGGWSPVPAPLGAGAAATGMIFRASLCVTADDALKLLTPFSHNASPTASVPAFTQTLPSLPLMSAASVTQRSAPRQSLLFMPLAPPTFGVRPAEEDSSLNPLIENVSAGAVQKITLCGKDRCVRGVAVMTKNGDAAALELQFVDGLVPGALSLAVGRIARVEYSCAGPGFVSLGKGDAVYTSSDVSDGEVAALHRAAAATLEPEKGGANMGHRTAGSARGSGSSLLHAAALVPRIVASVRALHSPAGELLSAEDPCTAFWAPLDEGDMGVMTARFNDGGGAGAGGGDCVRAGANKGRAGVNDGVRVGPVSAADGAGPESSAPRRKPPTFTLVGRIVNVLVEPPDEGRFTSDALKAAAGPDDALAERAFVSHAALAVRDTRDLDKLEPLPLYRRFVGCGSPDLKLLITLAHVPLEGPDSDAGGIGAAGDAPDTISLYVRCHLESGAGILPIGFGPGAVVAVDSVRRMIRRNHSCYATSDEGVISLLRGRDDIAALLRVATLVLGGARALQMDHPQGPPDLFAAANASALGSASRPVLGTWKSIPFAKVFWESALKGSRAPLRPLPESVARLIKGRRIKLVHVRASDAERILERAAGEKVEGSAGGAAPPLAKADGGRTLPLLYAVPLDAGEPSLPLLGPSRRSVEAVAEGDAAALEAAVTHMRVDKSSLLTLYVADDAAWLRVTVSGLWCDGTAEVHVKAADAYASAHASVGFTRGSAARLLRFSHRALGHWGATAARVGVVTTPFGSGASGRGAEMWLGDVGIGSGGGVGDGVAGDDDESFHAVTASRRQTAPWIDALLERTRTGAGGRASRRAAAPLGAPKAEHVEPAPHRYDPADDDSDADTLYWKAVSAVRSARFTTAEAVSARKSSKRTRESQNVTDIAAVAVWRAALAALAPDASSRASLAIRWNALGFIPAADVGLRGAAGTAPLPSHVTAALGYVHSEAAGFALRRAITARLSISPAPRGALAWRLLAAPYIPTEFDVPESRGARAASSRVSREFIWRRDAALREAAPSVAAAICAARGHAGNDRVLVPHAPRTPFVSPPTNISKDVTIGEVTLRAHALPTLRLRALAADGEDAEEGAAAAVD